MNQPIIQIENLSKAYRIGMKEEIPDTLVAAATSWMTAPLRNWRRLRKLNTFAAETQSQQSSVESTTKAGGCRPSENSEPGGLVPSPPTSDIIWALRDVSLNVNEGEVIGIIGRNGAGKSTLLKVLSRITEPTSGRAIIRGRVSSLLEVGTGFHPELTGRENIYMNGTILGMRKKEIDRKFDEIADFSGVEQFLDTPIKRYSSGMKVRLAFAVAAHLDPEILMIDEVLAVGDAEFQRKCLGKMRAIAKGGRTVLFVSHNMSSIQSLTSKCALMQDATLAAHGESQQIIDEYLLSFVEHDQNDFRDVSRLHSHHGSRIRITQISPLCQDNKGFFLGQQLAFEVELDVRVTRPNLLFGATVVDLAAGAVFTTFTRSNIEVTANTSATFCITMRDTRLAPGTYSLALSVGEGSDDKSRTIYDVVNPGPTFAVFSLHADGTPLYQWQKAWYGSVVHTDVFVTEVDAPSHLGQSMPIQESL